MASGFGLRASGGLRASSLAFAAIAAVLISASTLAQTAGDEPDLAVYARLRDEGLSRSRVMDYAFELMDRIGARLSGSPNLDRAVAWTMGALRQGGLANVRQDRWGEFGLGWRQRSGGRRSDRARRRHSRRRRGAVVAVDRRSHQRRGRLRARVQRRGRLRAAARHAQEQNRGARPRTRAARSNSKRQPLFERFTDAQFAEFATPPPGSARRRRGATRTSVRRRRVLRARRSFLRRRGRASGVDAHRQQRRAAGSAAACVVADWNYTLGMYAYPQGPRRARAGGRGVGRELRPALAAARAQGAGARGGGRGRRVHRRSRTTAFNVFAEIPGIDPVRGQRRGDGERASRQLGMAAPVPPTTAPAWCIAMEAMRILRRCSTSALAGPSSWRCGPARSRGCSDRSRGSTASSPRCRASTRRRIAAGAGGDAPAVRSARGPEARARAALGAATTSIRAAARSAACA